MSTDSKIIQAAKAKKPPTTKTAKPVDVNSPEYKAASRKWTSLMVGLPFLIVSSYFLYDRRELLGLSQAFLTRRSGTRERTQGAGCG